MHDRAVRLLFVTGVLALALAARAENKRLAPIPLQEAVSSHGPFEMGACETCHQRHDPKNPGPAVASSDLCFDCHDEFRGKAPVKMDKALHPTAKACTTCHNPHNAKKKKLRM
jgi:predicted CXXCH cytochrome family protein